MLGFSIFNKPQIAKLLDVFCCPTNKVRKGLYWLKQNLTDQVLLFSSCQLADKQYLNLLMALKKKKGGGQGFKIY